MPVPPPRRPHPALPLATTTDAQRLIEQFPHALTTPHILTWY
jgi:hypothetical protein